MSYFLFVLIATHLSIVSVTLYLHRSATHRSVEFHPLISHMMRFWLWLTTGMVTREWVAVHRSHHQSTDQLNDPHSPQIWGLWTVLFSGWKLYTDRCRDHGFVARLSRDTVNDWLEQNVYSKHHRLGIMLYLVLCVLLFGAWGVAVWLVQMIWIPFFAAGIINGVGHYWGYRNYNTDDQSRNIFPIGILIGGEELHNNHHQSPASAKLSAKWYEFDIGYFYIRILEMLGLATQRR